MARESQDARDARAARYSLGVQQEVTAEMRCAVRDAITALDAVIVGDAVGALEPLEPRAALAG